MVYHKDKYLFKDTKMEYHNSSPYGWLFNELILRNQPIRKMLISAHFLSGHVQRAKTE